MQEADYTRFAGIMAKLGVVYMRDVDDPIIEVYWQHLNGYDIDRIGKACELVVDMLANFPKVAEIIKHLPPIDAPERLLLGKELLPNEKVWVKYQYGFIAYLFSRELLKVGVTDSREKRTQLLLDYLRKREKGYQIPRDPKLKRLKNVTPKIPIDEEISLIEIELHEFSK